MAKPVVKSNAATASAQPSEPKATVSAAEMGARQRGISVSRFFSKNRPLLGFAKLLYGSKFHRLRMSRGQQGIGISAAGMYAQLTTGKPVQIISRTGARTP